MGTLLSNVNGHNNSSYDYLNTLSRSNPESPHTRVKYRPLGKRKRGTLSLISKGFGIISSKLASLSKMKKRLSLTKMIKTIDILTSDYKKSKVKKNNELKTKCEKTIDKYIEIINEKNLKSSSYKVVKYKSIAKPIGINNDNHNLLKALRSNMNTVKMSALIDNMNELQKNIDKEYTISIVFDENKTNLNMGPPFKKILKKKG